MRIKGLYIKYSIISCLGMTLLTLLSFGYYGPLSFKEVLLGIQVGVIPLSLILVGLSLVVGSLIGFSIEIYINRSLNDFSRGLMELERGNLSYKLPSTTFSELEGITLQFDKLSKKMQEQVLTVQNKTNERVQNTQDMLEQAITNERNRLARELHDSVSQQLFAISMMSSAMNELVDDEIPLKKQLQVVEEMSIQAQGEMRALLLQLRPVQLEGKKLIDGITELLTELMAKQHLDISWHMDPLELEKGIEDHLFRILQEAISNTLRHGKATRLEIRLRKIESFAIMRVIDDGIGFDPKVRKAGSYGLSTMQERVSEIGGNLKIISVPKKGTQIEVKVPFQLKRTKEEL